jgi:acyl dehydratase
MGNFSPEQRGMFFEEFEVGLKIITPGRTVTEADIVNFAGLSGDFYQLHMMQNMEKLHRLGSG